jgi:tRNA uridine 5-carbamoylmethylation protein Kti12
MRYEWYQLARKHSVAFTQIFFDVDVATAKSRNASRDQSGRVADDVIIKMASSIEKPNRDSYPWERRSLEMGREIDMVEAVNFLLSSADDVVIYHAKNEID